MKKIIRKIIWPLYLIAIIFLTSAGFMAYLDASSILSDYTEVDAPIQLVDTDSRTKKGHTTTTFIFNYSYQADGKDYVAEYSAVNEKGEKYLTQPSIKIAYSNAEPSKVGALHVLERQGSLFDLIKRVAIGSVILGLIALVIYAWAGSSKKEEGAEEAVEEPAKA